MREYKAGMETETPLVFGGDPKALVNVLAGDGANDIARRPRPELLAVTKRVIAVLEPLDVAARERVMRAVLALLGL